MRENGETARGRTACPIQKSYLRDPSRNDPASHPSGTAQDRTCVARGIRSRHSIQPYAFNMVSQRSPQPKTSSHSPNVLDDRCTRGDEVPLVHIILRNALWDSEREWTTPPEQFFDHRRDVRQVFLIRELWQTVASNDSVQLFLGLFHDVGVESRY